MARFLAPTTWFPALLLVPIAFAMKDSVVREPLDARGHQSGLMARVKLLNGSMKTATLEGLGCTRSICSRVAIKGRNADGSLVSLWLDEIAAIRDTNSNSALLVLKDGTEQRISLVTDFRVVYLSNPGHGGERLDLTRIRSVEFAASKD